MAKVTSKQFNQNEKCVCGSSRYYIDQFNWSHRHLRSIGAKKHSNTNYSIVYKLEKCACCDEDEREREMENRFDDNYYSENESDKVCYRCDAKLSEHDTDCCAECAEKKSYIDSIKRELELDDAYQLIKAQHAE